MNKIGCFVFGFVLGAGVGVLAISKYVEKKYRDIANEEIESVKNKFTIPKNESTETVDVKTQTCDDIINKNRYATNDVEPDDEFLNGQDHYDTEECESVENDVDVHGQCFDKKDSKDPFVISPEEFGELEDEGYQCISLMFYTDGVLADDMGDVVTDIRATVGNGSLDSFGEYDDDCVYVRNSYRKCDYEILRSEKSYSESFTV